MLQIDLVEMNSKLTIWKETKKLIHEMIQNGFLKDFLHLNFHESNTFVLPGQKIIVFCDLMQLYYLIKAVFYKSLFLLK